METLTLIPYEKSQKQTIGKLFAPDNFFLAYTLELPYLGNQRNFSCIPRMLYVCKRTFSMRFKRYTYEVLNVPDRSAIRIHSVNFSRDLRGCIGLGNSLSDIDHDGLVDLQFSRDAIKRFEQRMKGNPFYLDIRS